MYLKKTNILMGNGTCNWEDKPIQTDMERLKLMWIMALLKEDKNHWQTWKLDEDL